MADVRMCYLKATLCLLIIFHVQNSRAFQMSDVVGALVQNIYSRLPFDQYDEAQVQERPNNDISLMQEIKSGRHGHGSTFHLYGRHGGPSDFVDVSGVDSPRRPARTPDPKNVIEV